MSKQHPLFLLTLLFLTGCTLAWWYGAASQSQAAPTMNIINVTSTVDVMDELDGECSLREALHNANTNSRFSATEGECEGGSGTETDVIVLQSGQSYHLTLEGPEDDEGSLDVRNNNTAVVDLRIEISGGAVPATIQMTLNNQRVMQIHGAAVEITDVILAGGMVDGPGGAILNHAGGHLTLTDVTLQNNSANNGGGLYNQGTAVLINSQVMDNSAALNGGGLANSGGGSVTIDNSHIEHNVANQNGGGIYNLDDESTLTIANSQIISNTAVNGDGGALYTLADVTMTDSHIIDNEATYGVGGALYNGSAALTLEEVWLEENRAIAGGGIYNANGQIALTGGAFQANQALATDGGGLYSQGAAAQLILSQAVFRANAALNGSGGALYLASATTTYLTQSAVVHNEASETGGGIAAHGNLTIGNTTISSNSAGSNGGGLTIGLNGSVTAVNMTLAMNTLGRDLYTVGELTLQNSIINTPGTPNCMLDSPILSLGNNLSDDDSCEGLDEETDLVTAVLLLAPLDNYNSERPSHALLPGSPALDAGDSAACAANPVNNVDQRGLPRPYGPACDMGAHEEQPPFRIYLPIIQRS